MLRACMFWGLLTVGLASVAAAIQPILPPIAPPESFKPEERTHWAYHVADRPQGQDVREKGWVKNPIDRFVLEGLESVGFQHAPEADRSTLIRRLAFDLTGLPPTPAEIEAFLADGRPDAYERLVDRLLESPHYGERWAQHWLDLAHYADSNGFDGDADRPDAWRFRDWVVAALNADTPYDQFVTLQLAGDEAAPSDSTALIATGFGRCGPRDLGMGKMDPDVKRQAELTEITGTVGSVFLGLTIGCARCHDHKFDALPTTDYYRLQSFFAASQLVEVPIASTEEKAAFDAERKVIDDKLAAVRAKLTALEAPYRKALDEQKKAKLSEAERALIAIPEKDRTAEQKKQIARLAGALRVFPGELADAIAKNPADLAERQRLNAEFQAIRVGGPRPPAQAMALVDKASKASETFVARRGDVKNAGPRVAPRPPGVILAVQPSDAFEPDTIAPTKSTTGRRIALARWLTRPDNPLTARVIVNRLWQHHFGRGIVATPSDFGVHGEPPSHPELLDWLAAELVANGWRLKAMHRLMVTSAAYRQSSSLPQEIARAQSADDPENTLLWRMNRRRMEAESLRDAMLAVSGELNPKAGGPGVREPMGKEVESLIFTTNENIDSWHATPDVTEHARRSLYLFRKRNVRYPMFDAFDAPDSQTACPQRAVSTHALQALILMNGDFASARAKALAGRLYRESGGDLGAHIRHAYRVVLARDPAPIEITQARNYLDAQAGLVRQRHAEGWPVAMPTFVPEDAETDEAAALVDFARAMLNRNEFLYVP